MMVYPTSSWNTEVGQTYNICSLNLTEGKWLLIEPRWPPEI